jgi:hypothetical protein
MAIVAFSTFASHAPAQSWSTLDLAGGRVEYFGFLPSLAMTIGASTGRNTNRTTLALGGVSTFFESGSNSTILTTDAAWRPVAPSAGRPYVELYGSGALSRYTFADPVLDGHAGARLRRGRRQSSIWIGGDIGGAVGRADATSIRRLAAGGSWATADRQFSMGGQARSTVFDHASAFTDVTADVEAQPARLGGRVSLALGGGLRFEQYDRIRGFGAATVAVRLAEHVHASATFGNSLADPIRLTPQASFASIGLKFSRRTPAPKSRSASTPGEGFRATKLPDGRMELIVHLPGATRVEIIGDFTNWDPVMLRRLDSGEWSGAFLLSPGIYRYNVRVDGGDWIVPPGAGRVSDDFGGEAAVLVIPSP